MVNKLINDADFISVIDKVHDVIEIWDDNYTLVYVNSAVYKSLGKRPSELIGKTLQEIQSDSSYWTPSMLKYIYKYKKKVVQTQKTILGSRYRCIGTPIINTSGLLTNIVITSRRIDDDLFKIVDPVLTNDEFLLDNNSSCSIIYKSEIMHETLSIAKKIGRSEATCLILGETGTGKNLLTKYIHESSPRHNETFLAINMASMNPNLIESELFGYDKGSFTGANKEGKDGLFKIANGGTLFLDEIGELPASIQAKFLHFLQEREFTPIGGTTPIKTDIRIIAATNQDLIELIKGGNFRKDLYYRLNTFEVTLPPLRERSEDVEALYDYYLDIFNKKYQTNKRFSPSATAYLQAYDWPGNVRELSNIIERSLVISDGNVITDSDLPQYIKSAASKPIDFLEPNLQNSDFNELVEKYKAEIINKFYKDSPSSRKLAKTLNISPSTAVRLIRKYVEGVESEDI